MELLTEVVAFAAKALIIVGLVATLGLIVARGAVSSGEAEAPPPLKIRPLNRHLRERAERIKVEITPAPHRKALQQSLRRQYKDEAKAPGGQPARPRLFVLDFEGDLRASAVTSLREEITALLQVAGSGDEIVVRLESPGGMVHSYGLAASQLARIRKRGIRLTVVVDKVAASGGYMMACVADRIIAAPFAIIGSIGVVLQMPNFHRFLKGKDIDFELLTAGEHKRTLTLFGENSEPARAKAMEELEDTHTLFKAFIGQHRPQLDVDRVANGEHWFGSRALDLGLVDELLTSDDYLLQRMETHDVFQLYQHRPKPLMQRIADRMSSALQLAALFRSRA
ncbi:MAG: protease SohB [Algiphilus sp.]|uniref:protease SohB n=1 Tax=Algiphilus sp. TaxID=1872431 RepID=UPI0025B7C406|nr:protease SohB [Algiphilus sp.]MCI5103876.1 protease SohB [Algiphilus sp.]